jgi:hypothetical protein
MPGSKESDKVQREIEELLEKLDNFVPEERLATKIKNRRTEKRRSERTGPTIWEQFTARFSRVTLGQIMIAGIICLAVAFLFDGPLGGWARWLTILGIVLTAGAFIMSVVRGGGSSSRPVTGRVQRRWRGEVIEYGEPSTIDRVRGWFRRKGRS